MGARNMWNTIIIPIQLHLTQQDCIVYHGTYQFIECTHIHMYMYIICLQTCTSSVWVTGGSGTVHRSRCISPTLTDTWRTGELSATEVRTHDTVSFV